MHLPSLTFAIFSVLCTFAAEIPDHAKVLQAQDRYFELALHPETHLIYGRVDLENPNRWRETAFPSAQEVRRRSGMLDLMYHDPEEARRVDIANCARNGGLFLGALVDAAAVTGAPQIPRQAEKVFEGLRSLARVSPREGFVASGLLPDGKTFLNTSSVDQYTSYLYGLWKYFHAPFCSATARAEIKEIAAEICSAIEKDGFAIMAANGIPAPNCDVAALRSNRSSRILMIYLVGSDLTENNHWLDIYRELLTEQNHARMKTLSDSEMVKFPHVPADKEQNRIRYDQIWQTQYSIAALRELETNPRTKATYAGAMRLNARICAANPRFGPNDLAVIALARERRPARQELEKFLDERPNEVFFGAYWSAARAEAGE